MIPSDTLLPQNWEEALHCPLMNDYNKGGGRMDFLCYVPARPLISARSLFPELLYNVLLSCATYVQRTFSCFDEVPLRPTPPPVMPCDWHTNQRIIDWQGLIWTSVLAMAAAENRWKRIPRCRFKTIQPFEIWFHLNVWNVLTHVKNALDHSCH